MSNDTLEYLEAVYAYLYMTLYHTKLRMNQSGHSQSNNNIAILKTIHKGFSAFSSVLMLLHSSQIRQKLFLLFKIQMNVTMFDFMKLNSP